MKRYFSLTSLALAVSLSVAACDKTPEEPKRTAPATSASAALTTKAEPAAAQSAAPAPAAPTPPANSALLNPEAAKDKAPAKFKVKFTTTKGDFVVEVTRDWAPIGADRFYNLAKLGFFDDIGFFRVVPDFVIQFGIHGNPAVSKAWRNANIQDDPKSKQSNDKGTLTYAKAGQNTRTTQFFINLKDNKQLDEMGFPPIGKVIKGMDVIEAINREYGEQPQQPLVQAEGNTYLRSNFPKLDFITSAAIVK